MKKWWLILLAGFLLTGCGQKDMETVGDSYIIPNTPEPAAVYLELPEDAAMLTVQNETEGTLYLCQGYTVTVQTFPAGDLDSTLRQVSGFGVDELRLYTLEYDDVLRHACVWVSAGEEMDQVGKAVILEDGEYHYAVTVMVPAAQAKDLTDNIHQILNSIYLE